MILGAVFLTGCAAPGDREHDPDVVIQPWEEHPVEDRVVGHVTAVDWDYGFVVIETVPGFSADPGTQLRVPVEGAESAVLVVSEEQRQPFLVANIQSGLPRPGAQVLIRVQRQF